MTLTFRQPAGLIIGPLALPSPFLLAPLAGLAAGVLRLVGRAGADKPADQPTHKEDDHA